MPLELGSISQQPGFDPYIPACFTSLEEAQNSFYYHQNRFLKATQDINNAFLNTDLVNPLIESGHLKTCSQNRDVFRKTLQKWSSAFDAFLLEANATMNSKALQGAAVLKITHRISLLNLEYHGQDSLQSSRCWDHLRRECEEIVDLATSVVNVIIQNPCNSSKKPIFSMDMNIVGPLFSIAHRCRDPLIRRRAIALLYRAPLQEGLWHSFLTAQVAEKIVKIEEAGLGEVKSSADVPEENRITETQVQFDLQGRKGYLNFSRRQSTGRDVYVAEPIVEVLQETVEW